jgi:response regulator of citrate/malate metabolism
MYFRSAISLLLVSLASHAFAQAATPKPANAEISQKPGTTTYVLKPHQAERMNLLLKQQEEAQKKGISPERHFQMQQQKQQEMQRTQRGTSNQPIAYAPKP